MTCENPQLFQIIGEPGFFRCLSHRIHGTGIYLPTFTVKMSTKCRYEYTKHGWYGYDSGKTFQGGLFYCCRAWSIRCSKKRQGAETHLTSSGDTSKSRGIWTFRAQNFEDSFHVGHFSVSKYPRQFCFDGRKWAIFEYLSKSPLRYWHTKKMSRPMWQQWDSHPILLRATNLQVVRKSP